MEKENMSISQDGIGKDNAVNMEKDANKDENKTKKQKGGLSRAFDNVSVSVLTSLYENSEVVVMFVATVLALFAKIQVIDHPTNDVVGYIFKWMDKIKEVGHSKFYLVDADYSPLYLFFANLISMIPKGAEVTVASYTFSSNWMTALKVSYFIFDIINAFVVYFLIQQVSGSKRKATMGYIIMTALPVQFINSAVWGQADCIYTCFMLLSLYFALRGKGKLSFLMFGFSISFKLQAVFIAPFLVYMLLHRKLKFTHVLFAPLAVLISFLPAYICGASFTEPFAFYGKQLGGYSKLTSGCANFWQLFSYRNSRVEIINQGAVYLGLLLIGVLFAIVWLRMVRGSKENLLNIAIFLIGVTVFFLPFMHERYFYSIDVLVVVYAITKGKRYYLIPLMQISSAIAYQNYIGGKYFINVWGEDSVHIAALINIFVLGTLLSDIFKAERCTLDEVLAEIKKEETVETLSHN